MQLQDYCDTLNIEITLTYYPNQHGRWCASFAHCVFKGSKGSAVFASTHGNGTTPHAALEDFLAQIRGKYMVVGAESKAYRRKYAIPETLILGEMK